MESLPEATRWKLEVLVGQVTVEVGVAPLLPVPPGPVLVAPHPVTTRAASAARPTRPTRRRRGPWLSVSGCCREVICASPIFIALHRSGAAPNEAKATAPRQRDEGRWRVLPVYQINASPQ